jgi:predicted DNA-binding protein (MmcQ/YjbR family)
MPAKTPSADALIKELRAFGLTYPGAYTKSPWPGHMDLAVKDKTFAFLSADGEPFSISCKLPESSLAALSLPHASPTGYGLGKSGWVSVTAANGETPPVELLKAWIDESYRAQAPKTLVASLEADRGSAIAAPKKSPSKSRKTERKPGAPAARKKASRGAAAARRKA